MRKNKQAIREEEPILPDGWQEGGTPLPASGGNENREEAAYGANQRGGAGARDYSESAAGDGEFPAAASGGGRPARVPPDGGAGEYPSGLGSPSDREPDSAAQRRVGGGDLLPGGDGDRGTLTDGADRGGGDAGYGGFSGSQAQFRAKAQAARILYPELRDLSDEDAVAVVLGGGMLGAYAGFRAREAVRLRRENDDLRRNRDASRRAPVRGVARGGPSPRGQDLFEQGFDQDGW